MKINNFGPMGVNPYKRNFEKNTPAAQTPQTKADKVEISSKAKDLQQANEITKARQEKIQTLKTQLENGSYSIDPKGIAEGLLKYYGKK
jgi:negative regulator of flagellin synthesis FlgM